MLLVTPVLFPRSRIVQRKAIDTYLRRRFSEPTLMGPLEEIGEWYSRIVNHLSGPFNFEVWGRRPDDGHLFSTERSLRSNRKNFDKDDQIDEPADLEEDRKDGQKEKPSETKTTERVDRDEANEQRKVDKHGLKGADRANGDVHLGQ